MGIEDELRKATRHVANLRHLYKQKNLDDGLRTGLLGPAIAGLESFLTTHGPVLLAAVRLAEAVDSRYRGSLDDDAPWMAQIEAINAYRAAKETRKP